MKIGDLGVLIKLTYHRDAEDGRDHDDLELRSDTLQVGVFHIANEY